jgi:hypothetical protein
VQLLFILFQNRNIDKKTSFVFVRMKCERVGTLFNLKVKNVLNAECGNFLCMAVATIGTWNVGRLVIPTFYCFCRDDGQNIRIR